MEPEKEEERIQLIVVGEAYVGKTSLLQKYTSSSFSNQFITTVGIDYVIKHVECEQRKFRVKIWDTAGQERYRSLTKNFFCKSDGVVIVFDLTDKKSFEKIQLWIHSVKEYSNLSDCMILLGNKVDIGEREVSTEQANLLAERYNIQYFETSAKENTNVDEAFFTLISKISKRIESINKNFELNSLGTTYSCCI